MLSLSDAGIPNDHTRATMKHGIQDKSTTATSIATVIVMRSCLEVSAAILCADSDAGSSNEAVAVAAAVIVAESCLKKSAPAVY